MMNNLPFQAEYAKSNRSVCKNCIERIEQQSLRLAIVIQSPVFNGQISSWYHFDCFFEKQSPEEVGDIEGFDLLRWQDQEKINEKLKEKKRRIDEETIGSDGPSEKKKKKKELEEEQSLKNEIKKQNEIRFKYRDQLEALSKQDLQLLLEHNEQKIISGFSRILDDLSDVMTFGALLGCGECKLGQLYYKTGIGYVCSERGIWTTCHKTTTPKRKPFKVPQELAEDFSFLKEYEYVPRQRLIPKLVRTARPEIVYANAIRKATNAALAELTANYVPYGTAKTKSKAEPKAKPNVAAKRPKPAVEPITEPTAIAIAKTEAKARARAKQRAKAREAKERAKVKASAKTLPPLKGLKFVLDSKLGRSKEDVEGDLKNLGGSVTLHVTKRTAALISSKDNVDNMESKLMKKAAGLSIPVVEVSILEAMKSTSNVPALSVIQRGNIAPWDCPDVAKRLGLDMDSEPGVSWNAEKLS